MAGVRLSRRNVLGGLVSAAAAGVAVRGTALASPAAGEPRRTDGMLRLGSNENSAGLGPAARAAFLAAIDEANRYPGAVWSTLVDALTNRHQVDRSFIHVTPGSGALLSAATLAFTSASRPLITAAPTFEAPTRTASRTGATVHAVPVTADGRLNLDAMLAKAAGAGLVYVCNPNNPTGGGVPGTALAAFVDRLKTVAPDARVLVDEAYFEYSDEPGYATAVPLAVADRRVLVTRTFSKVFGMAGLPRRLRHRASRHARRAPGARSRRHAEQRVTRGRHRGIHRHGARRRRVRPQPRRPAVHARALRSGRLSRAALGRQLRDGRHQARRRLVRLGMPPPADRGGAPFPPLDTCMRLTIGTQAEMDEAVPAILGLLQAPPPASARLRQGSGAGPAHPPFDWIAGDGC